MRCKARLVLIGLLGLLFGMQCAWAQSSANYRYRWVDPSGLTHYSDNLTLAAVNQGYDILNSNGMLVRHVQGKLTPEEIAAAKARAEKQSSEQEAARIKLQNDKRLLAAYPTEAAFKAAQQSRLDGMDRDIQTTRANIDTQQQILSRLLNHAAEIDHDDQKIPADLQAKIDAQRQTVLEQRHLLLQQLDERARLGKEVAANLAYYRQLRDSSHPSADKP